MEQTKGKVAFITGGASGIGLGMAQAFGAAGMKLVIADMNAARREAAVADLAKAGFDSFGVDLDVKSADSWAAAVDAAERHFGPIDLLCNNAGVGQGSKVDGSPVRLHEISDDLFRMVFDINVLGVFLGIRAVVPRMIERGEGGHIVNTSSMAGLIAPIELGAYTASKYAVMAMTESMRGELAQYGIGVSVLCPGGVQSNLVDSSAEQRATAIGAGSDEAAGLLSSRPLNTVMMEPLSVGRYVLAGIEANQLYILTHPEYRPLIEERFAAICAGFGESAQPGHTDPDSLMKRSLNPAYGEAAGKAA